MHMYTWQKLLIQIIQADNISDDKIIQANPTDIYIMRESGGE